jgi:hypothetical protein
VIKTKWRRTVQIRITACVATIAFGALAANRASADFAFQNFAGPEHDEGGFNLRAINSHGTTLGTVFDADFNERGFTRGADGAFAVFSVPNGSAGDQFQTQLAAMNDDNVVAAYLPTVPFAHGNPLLLLRDGAILATVPLPPEFGATSVRGLNNAGVMAGTLNDLVAHKPRGFVRDRAGNFTKFDVNETTLFTEVEGINNFGTAIGNFSIFRAFTQGFVRTVDGTITPLPTPETIGGKTVFAIFYSSINDAGVTVGSFQDPDENFFGFVRGPQGNYTLVQNPANPASSGLTGINNRGTAAGTYLDDAGRSRAFIVELCPTDADGDGLIGLSDLAILLAHFGVSDGASVENGDTDADGDVDLTDLASLLSHFGESCP